jgi:hypothetical protein
MFYPKTWFTAHSCWKSSGNTSNVLYESVTKPISRGLSLAPETLTPEPSAAACSGCCLHLLPCFLCVFVSRWQFKLGEKRTLINHGGYSSGSITLVLYVHYHYSNHVKWQNSAPAQWLKKKDYSNPCSTKCEEATSTILFRMVPACVL